MSMNGDSSVTLGGWLVHVMKEADGALSLEEALHVIMDSMKRYFPCQSVAVLLVDDDTKEMRVKISRQISYTFAKKFRRSAPGPQATRIVLEQEPLLLCRPDRQSETYQELKLEHDFRSAVAAPLIKNRRGIGYVFCDRSEEPDFTDSDRLHLQVIGHLIGNLMEKFELLQSSRTLSPLDDASQALKYTAFVPAFATELQRARTHDYPLTVALLFVDAFRKYVDTYGIDRAHGLLAEVVRIVRDHIREMDILARFGADEFILCLSGMTNSEARQTLAAIRDAVDARAGEATDIPVDLRIGALVLDEQQEMHRPLQELLAALGKNLTRARNQGADPIAIGHL